MSGKGEIMRQNNSKKICKFIEMFNKVFGIYEFKVENLLNMDYEITINQKNEIWRTDNKCKIYICSCDVLVDALREIDKCLLENKQNDG